MKDLATQREQRAVRAGRDRRNHGIVLIWYAILGLVLIGFVGLASDTGYVYLTSHELQNAADSAALAGAAKVKFDRNAAVTDAVNTASKNKAAQASVQLRVADNDVQVGNYNRGTAVFTPNTAPYNACKVVARRTADSPGGALNLLFGPIFGITTSNVSRTAIAMTGGKLGAGIVILDPSRKSSLGAGGSSILDVGTAAIQVNSNNSQAVTITGSKASITTGELRIDGGFTSTGNPTLPSKLYTGATAVDDPLASLPTPSKGTDLLKIDVSANGTATGVPGYYSQGITVRAGATLTLSPGIYVLGPPGLKVWANANLNAIGCMFFLTTGTNPNVYGTVDLGGGGTVNISPPTSGTYAGITFFQDPKTPYTSGSASIIGDSLMNLQGTIYLPTINLNMQGNSTNFSNQIIVDTINVNGNGTMKVNYDGRNQVEINNVFLVY